MSRKHLHKSVRSLNGSHCYNIVMPLFLDFPDHTYLIKMILQNALLFLHGCLEKPTIFIQYRHSTTNILIVDVLVHLLEVSTGETQHLSAACLNFLSLLLMEEARCLVRSADQQLHDSSTLLALLDANRANCEWYCEALPVTVCMSLLASRLRFLLSYTFLTICIVTLCQAKVCEDFLVSEGQQATSVPCLFSNICAS